MVILGCLLAMACLAPVLTPYDPHEQTTAVLSPPSKGHWLGTNDVGQDIFSQLVHGAQVSLAVAISVGSLATLFSVLVGAGTGYLGGRLDQVVMRLVDALLAVPPLIIMVLAGAYLKPGLVTLILLLSGISWPGGARMIRAQTLALKEKWHVIAAQCFGASPLYLLRKHIIPDLGPLTVALLLQNARRAVVMEAGLSFLGITDPMLLSWGKMLHYALQYIYLDVWLWWLLPVGLSLSLLVISFAAIGYVLEEILDPRLGGNRNAHH